MSSAASGLSGDDLRRLSSAIVDTPRPDGSANRLPSTVHKRELAQLLNLCVETVDRLAREGKLSRAGKRGHFILCESVRSYVAHLQKVAAGRRSADGSHDVAAESAQLKAAQRQLIELRTAKERGELVL